MKINRILESRLYSTRGDIYKIFEKKVFNSFYLERSIFARKMGKREQYQSRVEHIVFLVSFLEYFLG